MMQGDLTNPKYLDFISFAQHDTISQEMRRASTTFEEAVIEKEATDTELPIWGSQVNTLSGRLLPAHCHLVVLILQDTNRCTAL